jgi:hypothetical protein
MSQPPLTKKYNRAKKRGSRNNGGQVEFDSTPGDNFPALPRSTTNGAWNKKQHEEHKKKKGWYGSIQELDGSKVAQQNHFSKLLQQQTLQIEKQTIQFETQAQELEKVRKEMEVSIKNQWMINGNTQENINFAKMHQETRSDIARLVALFTEHGIKRTLPKDQEIAQSPSRSSPPSKKQKDDESDEPMQDETLDTAPPPASDNQSMNSNVTDYTDSPARFAGMKQTPVRLFDGASPISCSSEST